MLLMSLLIAAHRITSTLTDNVGAYPIYCTANKDCLPTLQSYEFFIANRDFYTNPEYKKYDVQPNRLKQSLLGPIGPISGYVSSLPTQPASGYGMPPSLPQGLAQMDYKEAWLNKNGFFFEQTPYRPSGTPEYTIGRDGYIQDLRQGVDRFPRPNTASAHHYNPSTWYVPPADMYNTNPKPYPVIPNFNGDRCGCDEGICKSRLYNGALDICFFCYPFCNDPYVFYRILKTRLYKESVYKMLITPKAADPALELASNNTFGKAPVACTTNAHCWYAREPLNVFQKTAVNITDATKVVKTTTCACNKGKCVLSTAKRRQCIWCGDNPICQQSNAFYDMVMKISS